MVSLSPSDLTDPLQAVLLHVLPPAKPGGRPRSVDLRIILNGIVYLTRTGCAWRDLPREYGPWSTVYHYFRTWSHDGTWERIQARFRASVRHRVGHDPTPSGAMIDSQSEKTTEQAGPHGFDGGKKANGRKQHLLVDTLGLILKVVVHPINLPDLEGGKRLLGSSDGAFPRLACIWADQGYAGAFQHWTLAQTDIELAVVYPWWRQLKWHDPAVLDALGYHDGFNVLPRRCVAERTIAWIGQYRRMSKDYERLPHMSEAFASLSGFCLLLGRLA